MNTIDQIREVEKKICIIEMIRGYYTIYPTGGLLHIVLDDYNIERENIRKCIDNAIHENHHPTIAIGELLLLQTDEDIERIVCEPWELYDKHDELMRQWHLEKTKK